MKDRLIKKLEEIKMQGNYAVELRFGEGIGCDDTNIKAMERRIRVIYAPIGYLGEFRKMWKGSLKDFLKFDICSAPVIISNPPKEEEYEDDGFYAWGTKRAVDSFIRRQ